MACQNTLAAFQCIGRHGLPATAFNSPSNPVWQACKANPQVGSGVLGVQVTDAPAGWSVAGCEVLHVLPGSAAASAGLVGAQDRTDPVGDVIFSIYVSGIGAVQTPSCAGFSAAMAETVPGMAVQVSYDHRLVELLVGSWEALTSPAVQVQG